MNNNNSMDEGVMIRGTTSSSSSESCLDAELWHACAGNMVQIPSINSKVFYFPQGHLEHAQVTNFDFGNFHVPPLIFCQVSAIKYLADQETDEVYTKLRLIPMKFPQNYDFDYGHTDGFMHNDDNNEKPASFAKTLTQSDANNGGGFSVPRFCAETIFPKLDFTADPPVQNIFAKDVHGKLWKFRHIFRGTPRRHLLTTGWSNFVNQKKLVAGDSIVFLRAENGDLCVGIRRAKRGFGFGVGGGPEYPSSGWNPMNGNGGGSPPFGGYANLMRERENNNLTRRMPIESVIEAASLAAGGQPFEVVYYPRASTPEFFVKASSVRAAMLTRWCRGMRFKMAFETEDSSRISWFMGTISKAEDADNIRWPMSPWRVLEVEWDEPDLLQNVKRVNPWLVELVSNIPPIHLSSFSPPRKKMRFPPQPDFPMLNPLPVPQFSSTPQHRSDNNPFYCISDSKFPAGIQGARHAQFELPTSDLHFSKLQSGLIPIGFQHLDRGASRSMFPNKAMGENVSCFLTMGNSGQSTKENDDKKSTHIVLFGQLIAVGQENSPSSVGNAVSNNFGNADKMRNSSDGSRKSAISSDGSGNVEKSTISSDGSPSSIHHNGILENSSDEGSPCPEKICSWLG
ncbi:hypothetical protein ACFE04_009739 [Oxalis oulophora]